MKYTIRKKLLRRKTNKNTKRGGTKTLTKEQLKIMEEMRQEEIERLHKRAIKEEKPEIQEEKQEIQEEKRKSSSKRSRASRHSFANGLPKYKNSPNTPRIPLLPTINAGTLKSSHHK
jgi:hypothetical protein